MKRYYQITQNGNVADIDIYGDITSFKWFENDVTAYDINKQIKELDVDRINVNINSCGGDVFEALAIYNSLLKHKAKIVTFCDGLAASAASIIFCAGDERIIGDVGMLMIHNAWSWAQGNANDLRKQADDLEKITEQSVIAYSKVSKLSSDELHEMMDNETWLDASECLEHGFATKIEERKSNEGSKQLLMRFNQSIKHPFKQETDVEDEVKKLFEEINDRLSTLETILNDVDKDEEETPPEDEETSADDEETSKDDEDEKEESSKKQSWNSWFKN